MRKHQQRKGSTIFWIPEANDGSHILAGKVFDDSRLLSTLAFAVQMSLRVFVARRHRKITPSQKSLGATGKLFKIMCLSVKCLCSRRRRRCPHHCRRSRPHYSNRCMTPTSSRIFNCKNTKAAVARATGRPSRCRQYKSIANRIPDHFTLVGTQLVLYMAPWLVRACQKTSTAPTVSRSISISFQVDR